jgi:hypothetical protein
MSVLLFIIISTSGVNSLLMPFSPTGVTTSFSMSRHEEAVFYNPAHFEASEEFNFWCFYNRFYVSMYSVSFVLSKRIKSIDFGFAVNNFDYGDIEWHPDYPTEDSITFYTANDLSIILSGKASLAQQGRVGVNLKYIYEQIYTYTDYTLAVDLSFAYGSEKTGISFGASNFGTRITLNNEEVNLPARISIGGFHTFKTLTTSVDLHYLVNNGVFEFGIGATLPVHKLLEFNAAVNYRENFYPGFGMTIRPGKFGIKYGAAFYPRNLGMVNIIGIGFGF